MNVLSALALAFAFVATSTASGAVTSISLRTTGSLEESTVSALLRNDVSALRQHTAGWAKLRGESWRVMSGVAESLDDLFMIPVSMRDAEWYGSLGAVYYPSLVVYFKRRRTAGWKRVAQLARAAFLRQVMFDSGSPQGHMGLIGVSRELGDLERSRDATRHYGDVWSRRRVDESEMYHAWRDKASAYVARSEREGAIDALLRAYLIHPLSTRHELASSREFVALRGDPRVEHMIGAPYRRSQADPSRAMDHRVLQAWYRKCAAAVSPPRGGTSSR